MQRTNAEGPGGRALDPQSLNTNLERRFIQELRDYVPVARLLRVRGLPLYQRGLGPMLVEFGTTRLQDCGRREEAPFQNLSTSALQLHF